MFFRRFVCTTYLYSSTSLIERLTRWSRRGKKSDEDDTGRLEYNSVYLPSVVLFLKSEPAKERRYLIYRAVFLVVDVLLHREKRYPGSELRGNRSVNIEQGLTSLDVALDIGSKRACLASLINWRASVSGACSVARTACLIFARFFVIEVCICIANSWNVKAVVHRSRCCRCFQLIVHQPVWLLCYSFLREYGCLEFPYHCFFELCRELRRTIFQVERRCSVYDFVRSIDFVGQCVDYSLHTNKYIVFPINKTHICVCFIYYCTKELFRTMLQYFKERM